MPFVPVRGFAPDADPTEPGVLVDCTNLLPSLRGVMPLPAGATSGVNSASASVVVAHATFKLDGSARVFNVGRTGATTIKAYEQDQADWTDVSRAAGTYSATQEVRPTFAQYGNQTLMAVGTGEPIQETTTGAFGDLTSAPSAQIVLVALDFAIALNTSDNTDEWRCSAAGDTGSWTADVATQAARGRLYDAPGPIVAGAVLHSNVVAFKERSVFIGQYVGPPAIWSWRQLPGDNIGAPGPLSVVDIETALLWPGHDNFYAFDGTRPVPLGDNRVAEFWVQDLRADFQHAVVGVHDRRRWNVYWAYPSKTAMNQGETSGRLDSYLAYNYRSNLWAYGRLNIQAVFEFPARGLTYDGIATAASLTYDQQPELSYDNILSEEGRPLVAVFDPNRALLIMDGTPLSASMETGDWGTDGVISLLDRVRPRFRDSPTTGTAKHLYKDDLGATARTAVASIALTDGAFDSVFAARWHRHSQEYTGEFELLGWDVSMREDSPE